MRQEWTEEEDQKLRELWPIATTIELRKAFLSRSSKALSERARRIGVKRYGCHKRIGTIEPLLQETAEAYYWAGFIAADGCVVSRNGCRTDLRVKLSTKDKQHLLKLGDFLHAPVRDTDRCSKVGVQDKIRVPLLENKFNMLPLKTYNPPANLCIEDDTNFISYFCGFIDGDGSIDYRRGSCRIECHVSWHSTLDAWLRRVHAILEQPMTGNICTSKRTRNAQIRHTARAYLSKNTMIQLKQKVVSLNLPLMERKWERIHTE